MLELNSVAFMQTSQNYCHHAGSNRGPSTCEADVITTTPWWHAFNSIKTVPNAGSKFRRVHANLLTYPYTFVPDKIFVTLVSHRGLSACEAYLTISYFTHWCDHFNRNKSVAHAWTKFCCLHANFAKLLSPRGLEPQTFCVWGKCDNHYTMSHAFNSIKTVPNAGSKFRHVHANLSTYPYTFVPDKIFVTMVSHRGFLHVKHIWQSLILHLGAIISTERSPLHMLELNSVAFMLSVQNIHKLSLLRKTFVTTRARTAYFLHVKNFWQSLLLHHGEIVSTATRPLQVLELNCCVHTKRSTYPYTFTSSQNFCSRGLEPRTFCVWGRCDNHYTMVTCFQQHQDCSKCRI